MKKLLAIILILGLLVSFGSCDAKVEKKDKDSTTTIELKEKASDAVTEAVEDVLEESSEASEEITRAIDPTGEEESAYMTYVDIATDGGATISIATMRGEEVIKEENHAIYKNSNIELEIKIVTGTTATKVIGETTVTGSEELASYRSGDTYYVAKKISPDGTFVLYRLETKPNYDTDILEAVLATINYEEQ